MVLLLWNSWVFGQNQVLFQENFDGIGPYKISKHFSANTGSLNPNVFWDTISTIAFSSPRSMKIKGSQSGTQLWIETDSFSTLGYPFITLKFNHVAKISQSNNCVIQYSTDGVIWNILPSISYKGSNIGSNQFYTANSFFNSSTYSIPGIMDLWESNSNSAVNNGMWASETFDLRGIAYDTVLNHGFPYFKLRFQANFVNGIPPSFNNYYDGWFVDDLEVIGSSCPLIPSTILFNVGPSVVAPFKPIGDLTINGNYRIALTANNQDTSIESVKLVFAKNGLFDTLTLVNSVIPADEYSILIPNLIVGDSIKWKVIVNLPNCSNFTSSPVSGFYQFQIIDPFPSKCGVVLNDQSPYIINDFPWIETFENAPWVSGNGFPNPSNAHRGILANYPNGNWQLVPNTDSQNATSFAWGLANSAFSGPNVLSGPSSNHSPNGSNFLFTSGNFNSPVGGAQSSNARITTPCIELGDSLDFAFEFWYHMYGQDIGSLRIDIDTGSSTSAWWNNYYSISGEQQSTSNSPWKKAFLSLIPFKGKTIKIRILSRKFSSGPQSFTALDDFQIYQYSPIAKEIGIEKINEPISYSCSFSSSEDVKIHLRNYGGDTLSEIPIAYQLDNNPVQRDTIKNIALLTLDTISYSFSQKINLLGFATYSLSIWTELIGDTINDNDSLHLEITSSDPIQNFPFLENFESSTPIVNLSGTGTLNSGYFILNKNDNSSTNGAKWMIKDGPVRKIHQGPISGANRSANYLLFHNEGLGTENQLAILESSCIDFSNLQNPQLSFHYHNFSLGSELQVKIRELNSTSWQNLGTLSQIQTQKLQEFQLVQLNLAAFAGKVVRIRFEGKRTGIMAANFAVDDIRLFEGQPSDYALASIPSIDYGFKSSIQSANITFTVMNHSSNMTASNMVLKMSLKKLCSAGNPIILTGQSNTFATITLMGTNKSISQMINFSNPLLPGKYEMKAWIEASGDPNHSNDTIQREIIIVESQNLPYFNDFENCASELFQNGEIYDWAIADATKSNWTGAKSGQNTWITHKDSNGIGSKEYLIMPFFEGFDTIYDSEIRFWQNYDFGNGFGSVEFRSGGIWESITIPGSNLGINWNTQFYPSQNKETFTGNSNGWIYSAYPLKQFNGLQSPLRMRFATSFENSPGWAIDDLEIFVPEQNSASPIEVIFDSNSPPTSGLNDFKIKVTNTGHAPLDEFELDVNANGTNLSQQFVLSSVINMGQSTVVSFNNPLNLIVGSNHLQIISSRPNDRKDEKSLDDTLNVYLTVLPRLSALPYCNDFEQGESFLNYDIKRKAIDTNWIYGSPNKTILNSVYSGNKAWFTSNSDYPVLSDQYLFTPEFSIVKNQCYEFSFWHQFETENNFDGATVEYTLDTGKTWLILGNFGDSSWFNTPHIQALDAFKPGWSGLSNGWEKVSKSIEFFTTSTVQFRFRFSSNSIRQFDGWIIDDFCFEETTTSCSFIGEKEKIKSISNLEVFPNPAKDIVKLNYKGKNHGEVKIKIMNSVGQLVFHKNQWINPQDELEINIEQYSKGLYIIQLEFSNQESINRIFEKL